MSKFSSHAINVSSGCDIVKCLRDFKKTQNLGAAFVVQCVGEISRATLRMADATNLFEPVKEISDLARIESLVGTISGGNGHLHLSLSSQDGAVVGGHVFGPVVASGTVKIVFGECENLSFTRSHDQQTGYPELLVLDQETENLQSESHKPISQEQLIPSSTSNQTCVAADAKIKVHAFRLVPKEDIADGLKNFVSKHKLKAPFIMTCVGSVTKAVLSLGHAGKEVVVMEGHYEIVSLLGTPSNLQLSLADQHGHVTTGHVTGELIVFTTAELVIGDQLSGE